MEFSRYMYVIITNLHNAQDSVTHNSNMDKTSITVQWRAPLPGTGAIKFR